MFQNENLNDFFLKIKYSNIIFKKTFAFINLVCYPETSNI